MLREWLCKLVGPACCREAQGRPRSPGCEMRGWFKSGFSPVLQVQSLITIKAPGHLQQPCGGRQTAGTVTASNSQGTGLREAQQHFRGDARVGLGSQSLSSCPRSSQAETYNPQKAMGGRTGTGSKDGGGAWCAPLLCEVMGSGTPGARGRRGVGGRGEGEGVLGVG